MMKIITSIILILATGTNIFGQCVSMQPVITCPASQLVNVDCSTPVPAATDIASFIALGGTFASNCPVNISDPISSMDDVCPPEGGPVMRTYTLG
jgi:hypothetical protein